MRLKESQSRVLESYQTALEEEAENLMFCTEGIAL